MLSWAIYVVLFSANVEQIAMKVSCINPMNDKQTESNRFRESSDQVEIFAQLMKSQIQSEANEKESPEQKELINSSRKNS